MNIPPLAEAYLRFLKLSSSPANLKFDANHKALFEAAVMHWSMGKSLSVLETIRQTELGSPATLHKRLKRLIAQELLKSEALGVDKRTKFVVPPDKVLSYMDGVGDKQLTALSSGINPH